MNIDKIKSARTKIIGKKIEYFKEIDSTHIYAKNIAEEKKEEGLMLLAEVQTGAIGTKGRSWYTGEGKNIAATIILYPKCKIEKLNNLTVEIAKKIRKAIYELYGYELEINVIDINSSLQEVLQNCIAEDDIVHSLHIAYIVISKGEKVDEVFPLIENFSMAKIFRFATA